jgi:Flp pilus assembly protein TadD
MAAAAAIAAGAAFARQGRLAEAEAAFRQALTLEPDHPEARYNLGVVLRDQSRLAEAEAAFRAALAVRPGHPETCNNLGLALLGQSKAEEAEGLFRQALALKPDHARAYNNLGAALIELGRLDEAQDAFGKALAHDQNYAKAYNNLGVVRQYQGDLGAAGAAFERAVAADRAYAEARFNLAGLARGGPTAERQARELEGLLPRAAEPKARSALLFALARLREMGGEHDAAFDALAEANALHRRSVAFDIDAVEARLVSVAQSFDAGLLQRLAGSGAPSRRPIFVVGMPRSGTTLVEQVLSAHPSVRGGGELRVMGQVIAEHSRLAGPFPDWAGALSQADCARLGRSYLDALGPETAGEARVTDKAVSNIEAMGLIHLCLPDATIVHCRRDARDAALSCFATRFSEGQAFAYDLMELGRYWRACEALMDHWRAVLPPGLVLEVDYETLVGDLEGQARRMIAHCGLAWDAACLAFHASGREVRTASATQVRQPIYASSIGRWRKYAHRLGPLIAALGG